ncbi:MAG: hypothetical protein HS101_02070 [Planctomycetia bacterium]|jgi:hypothetical protein|nr:hypothetical protein [Planctomycetia bacterium]MCC7314981.1 hypothetical protein [Planctomycetota bacterium]
MNQLAGHAEAGRFAAEKGDSTDSPASPARKPAFSWLKKLGFFGFMFFLLKGLLWLAIPAILANRLAD